MDVIHLGRGHNAEGHHHAVGVFLSDFGDEQRAHAAAGAATQRVAHLEAWMSQWMYVSSRSIADCVISYHQFKMCLRLHVPVRNAIAKLQDADVYLVSSRTTRLLS
jgi:hypothetical protein